MEREELRKFRAKTGKTQEEMAKSLGITLSFYSKIELGLKSPSLKTIKKFTEVFPRANVNKIFLT